MQFKLTAAEPRETPSWLIRFFDWLGDVLEPVGRLFAWIGNLFPDAPYAQFLLWSMLAALALVLLWMIYQRLRDGYWSLPKRRRAGQHVAAEVDDWAPEEHSAMRWLEQADALAAQGRYPEAVHHLLLRSIDDIENRRPELVQPAITSREIASASAIPAAARALFASIASLVERSLFGGRPVEAAEWQEARQAYAQFALPRAWRA